MKPKTLKPLWICLIVVASLLLLAVIVGVLNGTVGKGEWQIGWQSYRYECVNPNVGSGTVYYRNIRSLEIDWICGDVELIVSDDDAYLSVTEIADQELSESAQTHWWMNEEGVLMIKSRKSGDYLASSMPKKKLILL